MDSVSSSEIGLQGAAQGGGSRRRRSALLMPAHLLGKLIPGFTRPTAVAGEILVLSLLAVVLGHWISPNDPLLVRATFPWVWLAPVVLALRYGSMAGIWGAIVLMVAWFGLNVGQWDTFPQLYFLGGSILVVLTGEFSGAWQTRMRRAETAQTYVEQRFEQLLHQHYLLRLSHDRLARELIERPMSVHDALVALHDAGHDHGDGRRGTEALLRVVVQFCQIDCAAIHAVHAGQVNVAPAAVIGPYDTLETTDALVRQALATGKLSHISQAVATQQDSRYVVAAPLRDLEGGIYGLLVVQDMPFLALQTENLQALELLLVCYTDNLSMSLVARPLVDRYPDCPLEFAFELERLARVYAIAQLPSAVLTLTVSTPELAQHLLQMDDETKGDMDQLWLIERPGRHVLAVLVPFGSAASAGDHLAALEHQVRKASGQSFSQAGIAVQIIEFRGERPAQIVERIHAIAGR